MGQRIPPEQMCAGDEAMDAVLDGIAGMAQLLSVLRKQLAALEVPSSESAAELSQGLDIAWVGARRLLDELTSAQKMDNSPSRSRPSQRRRPQAQPRAV